MADHIHIRSWRRSDPIEKLTRLIHAAYASLGRQGWNFNGVDQPDEITAQRVDLGLCLVAEARDTVIGTISVHGPFPSAPSDYITRPGVAYFQQFAVHPDWQKYGVGGKLLEQAEICAAEAGYAFLSTDTAVGADDLLRFYGRRGYERVGEMQWPGKTYRSVILSKPLAGAVATAALASAEVPSD